MSQPKTLSEAIDAAGGLDEVTCRRLLALLFPSGLPAEDRNSEPLEVRLP